VQGMVVGVWVSWFSSSWWQVYVDMDFVRIVQVEGEREGEKRGGDQTSTPCYASSLFFLSLF